MSKREYLNKNLSNMDLKLRKILRDFINWQGHNNLLKDPLTIDYELAETYLEETKKQLKLYGVVLNEVEQKDDRWEELNDSGLDNRHPITLDNEVELVCIFESDKPNCICEFNHCLKKGY